MALPGGIVYCEVCDLSHRASAPRCEACDHVLGTAPDLETISNERRKHKGRALLCLFVLAGFFALDVTMVAAGATRVLICVPAVAGLAWSGYRYRLLSAWLLKAQARRV